MGDLRGLPQHDDRAAERTLRLSAFFTSGHAADLILAILALELIWLVRARGWSVLDAAFALAPGALMIVALRLALTGAGWPWIALTLAASFPAHLVDLRRREARGRRSG